MSSRLPGAEQRRSFKEKSGKDNRHGAYLCRFLHGGRWWTSALTVIMDHRRRLKDVFIGILVGVTVVIIYLTADKESERRYVPAYKQSSSTVFPSPEQKWEDPGPYHVAYPRHYRFILDDIPTCTNTTPFLILMVPVAPFEVAVRETIRRTWGGKKVIIGHLVETVFVVGLPGGNDASQQQERLKQEKEQYRDLIQSNFQDSYHNLTIKTMVMLEWVAQHCGNAAFMIKIDSDMLLHVKNLVTLLLNANTPKENYMTGLVWWHSPVLRNPFNKFFMPRYVIAEPEYPPYPLGMAYVMSVDLPKKILSVSPQIKPICIEDAYLGMCLKRLGISPTDPPDKTMFQVTPQHPLSSCSLSNVIAMTTTSIAQMRIYWQRIMQEVQC